jgi:hypothetical protein
MSPLITTILISLAKTIGLIFVIILPMVSYTVYAVASRQRNDSGPNLGDPPVSSSTGTRKVMLFPVTF